MPGSLHHTLIRGIQMSFLNPVEAIENEIKSKVGQSAIVKHAIAEWPVIASVLAQINWKAYLTDILAKYGVSPASATAVENEAAVLVNEVKADLPEIKKDLGIK